LGENQKRRDFDDLSVGVFGLSIDFYFKFKILMKNDKSIGFSGLSIGLFDLLLVFLVFQKKFQNFKK
jgi:hypothetical protein